MSHARLQRAAITGVWPTRTITTTAAARQAGDGGALIGRGVGTTAADRRTGNRPAAAAAAAASRSPMLLQPIIPCRGMASAGCNKVLTGDNVFENLRKMEYAVRGPLLIRALEIEKELQKVTNIPREGLKITRKGKEYSVPMTSARLPW